MIRTCLNVDGYGDDFAVLVGSQTFIAGRVYIRPEVFRPEGQETQASVRLDAHQIGHIGNAAPNTSVPIRCQTTTISTKIFSNLIDIILNWIEFHFINLFIVIYLFNSISLYYLLIIKSIRISGLLFNYFIYLIII